MSRWSTEVAYWIITWPMSYRSSIMLLRIFNPRCVSETLCAETSAELTATFLGGGCLGVIAHVCCLGSDPGTEIGTLG